MIEIATACPRGQGRFDVARPLGIIRVLPTLAAPLEVRTPMDKTC